MTHEIVLHDLTLQEWLKELTKQADNDWENYKRMAILLIMTKEMHVFESEILKKHEATSMEEVLKKNSYRYYKAGTKNKHFKDFTSQDFIDKKDEVAKLMEQKGGWTEDDFETVWFDIALEGFNLTPDDVSYDDFLSYEIRNLELREIDDFLKYQMETHFDNDASKFTRFMKLTLRKNEGEIIAIKHVETVKEFLEMLEKKALLETENETKKEKKAVKRHVGDTALSLAQTNYFINLLREAKVIFKDGKLLPDTRIGEAFNILTGYSFDTIRTGVGINHLNDTTYTDRKTVRDILHVMLNIVNREIDEQRSSNKDKP